MTLGIRSWIDEGIGYVILSRPEHHNAISKEMWLSIPRAMNLLKRDGAKLIILCGEGDDFSSGANTAEASHLETMEDARELWHAIRDCLETVRNSDLPTIAMVSGACFGGGCLLACACDMRVASDDALFAIPIARLGLTLDDATIASVVSLVGSGQAKHILLTGDTIPAPEAARIGLINYHVHPNHLKPVTVDLAQKIMVNVPFSIAACKKAVNRIVMNEMLPAEANDEEVVSAFISEVFQAKVRRKSPLA